MSWGNTPAVYLFILYTDHLQALKLRGRFCCESKPTIAAVLAKGASNKHISSRRMLMRPILCPLKLTVTCFLWSLSFSEETRNTEEIDYSVSITDRYLLSKDNIWTLCRHSEVNYAFTLICHYGDTLLKLPLKDKGRHLFSNYSVTAEFVKISETAQKTYRGRPQGAAESWLTAGTRFTDTLAGMSLHSQSGHGQFCSSALF